MEPDAPQGPPSAVGPAPPGVPDPADPHRAGTPAWDPPALLPPGIPDPADPPPAAPPAPTLLARIVHELRSTLLYAVQVMIVVLLILNFVGRVSVVQGGSMEPGIVTGERIVVNLMVYDFRNPQRGDIIVFRNPRDTTKDYIKRVIGLPGEMIEIRAGVCFINGTEIEEPYVTMHDFSDVAPLRLGEKELFVMGDNRANSEDSRRWGALRMDLVRGKASLVFWPPERATLLP